LPSKVRRDGDDFAGGVHAGRAGAAQRLERVGVAVRHRAAARVHRARRPRAAVLQLHLGPSELGVACDRQVAGKMAGLPATNHVVDPWPSIRGTALHAWAADAFTADNVRHGLLRWVAEQRVTPHPDHPGTADLYDAVEQAVVDHKFLGETSMAKIRRPEVRRGSTSCSCCCTASATCCSVSRARVAVAAYPATASSLDGLYVWERAFTGDDGQLLPENAQLIEEVFAQTRTARNSPSNCTRAGCRSTRSH
jgi:hypothetical protein